jgi:hypothetical protein
MSDTEVQYGRRLDCAMNGCNPPHGDDGTTYAWPETWGEPDVTEPLPINNHAAVWVKRTIVISDWEEA